MPKRCPRTTKLFTLFSILLLPFLTLYLTQVIWMQGFGAALLWMTAHGKAVGLFWLLDSIPALAVYGLCRRLFPAYSWGMLLFAGISYASRIKLDTAGSPLQLSDFTMLGAAGDLTGYAGEKLLPSWITVAALVLLVLLGVLLWKKDRWRPPVPPSFVLGTICLFLTMLMLQPGGLQNLALALDEDCRDQEDRCQQEGMVLSLYTEWAEGQALENETFGSDVTDMVTLFQRDALETAENTDPDMELPDIIFITSESFFDLDRLPNLTFEEDPQPVFHELCQSCTNGRFLSNTYGGGTGNVEMELFTGLSSFYLRAGDSLTTLESDTYANLPTTVRLLKKTGYSTTFVHSHNSALYNRDETYPAIGFENLVFVDDFLTEPEKKGTYVSDESFAKEVIAQYEARDTEKPCFLYGMSMENHQAYTAKKYKESSGYPVESEKLTEGDKKILDALVYGLHDADTSLGMLVEYFSQVERPVLLVFVGDHLPSVDTTGEDSLYKALGYIPTDDSSQWDTETYRKMQSTDYVIWSNYEGKQTTPDRDEGCAFLGLHTLKRAGVPLNAYFRWLDRDVAAWMTGNRGRLFVDDEGVSYEEIPGNLTRMAETYGDVERGLIYGLS